MTREDLDAIAKAVVKELRNDDERFCRIMHAISQWAWNESGREMDKYDHALLDVVGDAEEYLMYHLQTSHLPSWADSSHVPSRDSNAALQVCRELVEQYRSDEDVYIWDLYKKSLAALGMETPGDPTPDSASGACQGGNEGGDSGP